MPSPRIFLLSPARCSGKRAGFLFNESAKFDLAVRIRQSAGVPLGELFTFMSGLYFRGKIAYSERFANPPPNTPGAFVITTNRGLVSPDTLIALDELRKMGCGEIDANDLNYREPLERDLKNLVAAAPGCDVVLLGSIASAKYVDVVLDIVGARLLFPIDFVGRGDMSRGGLMLQCARENRELKYAPVSGTMLHGKRPAKLSARKK
jgi:hypothetical protein